MDWTRKGPPVSHLITESRDDRKGRSRLAIVMPSFRKKDMLLEHLSRLSRQTMRDFDILVIYGREDDFVETPPWASILHMREKERNGSAGNFYAGCKKAFSDGYEYIIITDNDCLPESDGLVRALYESAGKGAHVSMPQVKLGRLKHPAVGSVHCYSCIRREVFAKVGFTYLPFYFGGEDPELSDRMFRAGFSMRNVETLVSHPLAWNPFISSRSRLYLYSRGGLERHLLGGRLFESWLSIYLGLSASLCMLSLGRLEMADELLRAMVSGSGLEFFRNAGKDETPPPKLLSEPEGIYLGEDEIGFNSGLNMGAPDEASSGANLAPGMGRAASHFSSFRKYFGKSVIIEYVNEMSELPIIMMSRSSYLSVGKEKYLIAKDRSKFAILSGFVLLFVAAVPMAVLSSALLARAVITKHVRGIKTVGYGVDKSSPRAEDSAEITIHRR